MRRPQARRTRALVCGGATCSGKAFVHQPPPPLSPRGTASWFTSDKTCRERHATPWFVERLDMDCDRLLRARLWKLYDEGHLFGRLRGGRGGAVEYMEQPVHPDE